MKGLIVVDIIKEIEELNERANKLNKERERAIWERNKAEADFSQALSDFNKKYGTSFTADDIDAEYKRVEIEVTEGAKRLRAELEAIERGDNVVSADRGINSDNGVSKAPSIDTGTSEQGITIPDISPSTNGTNLADSIDLFDTADEPLETAPQTPSTPAPTTSSGFDFSKYLN